MSELTSDHPFYEQLAALRGWAEAEAARANAGGERKLDRDALRAALDGAQIEADLWGIDVDNASDAELISQVKLADESIWFAPAIAEGIKAMEEGRLVTLYDPAWDGEGQTDELTFPADFGPAD